MPLAFHLKTLIYDSVAYLGKSVAVRLNKELPFEKKIFFACEDKSLYCIYNKKNIMYFLSYLP